MRSHFLLFALLVSVTPARAATALDALKLLPPGAAARLARIQAHEGQPVPDRWHLLVHDPKEEAGLREYVVAGGEIVASRAVSQFAESLAAEDVVGEAVKIDSDRAAKLAQQYAQANQLTVASLNYELKKPGEGAAPLWRITCVDREGKPFGHILLTATRGTVVAHDGFPAEPAAAAEKPEKVEKPERPRPPASARIARATPMPERRATRVIRPGEPLPPVAVAAPDESDEEEDMDEDEDEERPREGRPSFFRRAGGSLQKVFTGREATAR